MRYKMILALAIVLATAGVFVIIYDSNINDAGSNDNTTVILQYDESASSYATFQYRVGTSGSYTSIGSDTQISVASGSRVYFRATNVSSGSTISWYVEDETSNAETFSGAGPHSEVIGQYDVMILLQATAPQSTYTCYLYYDANGGSFAPGTDSYTSTSTSSHTFTISSSQPIRTNYDFLGWSESSSASTSSYSPGGTISVPYDGSKTLYAVWSYNPPATQYTISVSKTPSAGGTVSGGGSGTTGSTVSISASSKSNYTFSYWSISPSSAGTISNAYSANTTVTIGSANGTVTAHFSYSPPTYDYTITYNANGGTGGPSSNTTATSTSTSTSITLSSVTPTRTNYTFLGWSTSSTATTASYNAGGTYTFSNGTTALYAVWQYNTLSISSVSKQYAVAGSSVSFTASCNPSSGVSYSYSNASNGLSVSISGSTVTCSSNSVGTYTFTLSASKTNYSGSSTTVTVQFVPQLNFTNSPSTGILVS